MNESLNLIDSYFSKTLTDSEKQAFEERCISDPVFAEEVAFYVSARDNLKKELHAQKKKEFAKLHARLTSEKTGRAGITRKIVRLVSIAAAFLIVFLAWQLFFQDPSPGKLADQYINRELAVLGKTMGGSQDSLQIGISAYNQKQYDKAEVIFQALSNKEINNAELIKYLGIVQLAKESYDKALIQFEKLAGMDLESNPGTFYKALTHMKRSAPGDRATAKQLLEKVIEKDLPGRESAETWIKKL